VEINKVANTPPVQPIQRNRPIAIRGLEFSPYRMLFRLFGQTGGERADARCEID
jgi:hypothetical protein